MEGRKCRLSQNIETNLKSRLDENSINQSTKHSADMMMQSLTNFMKDKKLNVPDTMLIAGHKDPRMLHKIYNNLQVADVAKKLN